MFNTPLVDFTLGQFFFAYTLFVLLQIGLGLLTGLIRALIVSVFN